MNLSMNMNLWAEEGIRRVYAELEQEPVARWRYGGEFPTMPLRIVYAAVTRGGADTELYVGYDASTDIYQLWDTLL
jgi:hypothetical protein